MEMQLIDRGGRRVRRICPECKELHSRKRCPKVAERREYEVWLRTLLETGVDTRSAKDRRNA
jgi:hypothetical protein